MEFDSKTYIKEIFSAVNEFDNAKFDKTSFKRIKSLRTFLLGELKKIKQIKIVNFPTQAVQIVTIQVGNIPETRNLISEFKKFGIIITHNLNWSVREPEIPLIRIAITVKTTKEELQEFVDVLKKIKE